MTLALATIPNEVEHLPRWLEGYVVGGGLRELTAELAAIHDAAIPEDSIRDRLGDLLSEVLEGGLSALPRDELQHLLCQPYHLLELQEIVLLEGGPYWETIPRPAELIERVQAGKERLAAALFGPLAEPADEPEPRRRRSGRGRTFLTIAATAAIVFIATIIASRLMMPQAQTGVTWGWAKADAFPSNLPRDAYLNRLADEADEWFNKRPQTAAEAAKRISEFRLGCAALLLADHPQLTHADREWLRDGCKRWRDVIDKQLIKLEDSGDVASVLSATDATVRQLSKALRDQAAKG